jgi:hypothetical protein
MPLRVDVERRREDDEGEGDEQPDQTARHGSLLPARTDGGILRVTCQGRNSNFATLHVQIRGHDSWIHHGAIGADSRAWEGAEDGQHRVPVMGRGTGLVKRRIRGDETGAEDGEGWSETVRNGAADETL